MAHRPHLILLFIGTLCVACIVVSFTKRLPDFSDPTLGFEARGTELGQRITAWHNLLDETSPSGGQLIANPYEYLDDLEADEADDGYQAANKRRRKKPRKQHNNAQRHKNKKNKGQKNKAALVLTEKIQVIKEASQKTHTGKGGNALPGEDNDPSSGGALWVENGTRRRDRDEAWEYGRNVSFIDDEEDEAANKSIQMKKENWMKLTRMQPPPFEMDIHTSSDGFFCESPSM